MPDPRNYIGTPAQMRAAQQAYDDMAEPEVTEAQEEVDAMREAIRISEEFFGQAERALDRGDIDAAADYLACAMRELGDVATVEE